MESVTVFPNWSSIVTIGWVAKATPATVELEGSRVNTVLAAGANVIVNAGLVVSVRTPAVRVAVAVNTLSVPTRLILKSVKAATPPMAAISTSPLRAPAPVVIVIVTVFVASAPVVTVLPNWSLIVTTG